ncbi:MAG: 50S ribosomal protein L30 [Bacteroidales bacterium]|nr:50S ribosomal protein L30 [Bacteroidales bacterium]RLD39295.1 MAG: 50S ribosomal protein L30 [Bacteroidota bacterium]
MEYKKAKITQVRSRIGRPERQKRTLDALGLTKMNQVREVVLTPQVEGMINKIKHLLLVEEI